MYKKNVIMVTDNDLKKIIMNIISEHQNPYTQQELFDRFDNSYEVIDYVLSRLDVVEQNNNFYFMDGNSKYAVLRFDIRKCIIYYQDSFIQDLERRSDFKDLKSSIIRWVNYNGYFIECSRDPRFFIVNDQNIKSLIPKKL